MALFAVLPLAVSIIIAPPPLDRETPPLPCATSVGYEDDGIPFSISTAAVGNNIVSSVMLIIATPPPPPPPTNPDVLFPFVLVLVFVLLRIVLPATRAKTLRDDVVADSGAEALGMSLKLRPPFRMWLSVLLGVDVAIVAVLWLIRIAPTVGGGPDDEEG